VKGIFELTTPNDLLKKLRYEYEHFLQEPMNAYTAFNFFVTAEHLLDWVYPGRANKSQREQIRESSIALQICAHIANGAKHFQVEDKHHQSVSETMQTGAMYSGALFRGKLFAGRLFPKAALVVHLKGDAEQSLGTSITALALAAMVLEYWEKQLAAT
jgi:hypothetical protein